MYFLLPYWKQTIEVFRFIAERLAISSKGCLYGRRCLVSLVWKSNLSSYVNVYKVVYNAVYNPYKIIISPYEILILIESLQILTKYSWATDRTLPPLIYSRKCCLGRHRWLTLLQGRTGDPRCVHPWRPGWTTHRPLPEPPASPHLQCRLVVEEQNYPPARTNIWPGFCPGYWPGFWYISEDTWSPIYHIISSEFPIYVHLGLLIHVQGFLVLS